MTIKQLIDQLFKYKNQEAKVIFTVGNEDNDTLSTSDINVLSDTSESHEYIEIFVDETTCKRQL